MLPRPTAEPASARMKPRREVHSPCSERRRSTALWFMQEASGRCFLFCILGSLRSHGQEARQAALGAHDRAEPQGALRLFHRGGFRSRPRRSEEHTSELQSRENLVCRLLLEKKKDKRTTEWLWRRAPGRS